MFLKEGENMKPLTIPALIIAAVISSTANIVTSIIKRS